MKAVKVFLIPGSYALDLLCSFLQVLSGEINPDLFDHAGARALGLGDTVMCCAHQESLWLWCAEAILKD